MRLTGFRGINLEALIKFFIFLGFALFFYDIIKSGKVQLYVHPRIVPYMYFCILAMILISIFNLKDLFKQVRKNSITPYILFIVVLLLASFVPAKSMNTEGVSSRKITINNKLFDALQNNSSAASGKTFFAVTEESQRRDKLKLKNDTVIIDDNIFFYWIQELIENPLKYQDKKIEVVGLVYKNLEFKENEFVPARLLMACCTADLQPIGLLCRYDRTTELVKDSWVKVTGVIKVEEYKGLKIPVIVAEKVENTEKPNNEYVYPF